VRHHALSRPLTLLLRVFTAADHSSGVVGGDASVFSFIVPSCVDAPSAGWDSTLAAAHASCAALQHTVCCRRFMSRLIRETTALGEVAARLQAAGDASVSGGKSISGSTDVFDGDDGLVWWQPEVPGALRDSEIKYAAKIASVDRGGQGVTLSVNLWTRVTLTLVSPGEAAGIVAKDREERPTHHTKESEELCEALARHVVVRLAMQVWPCPVASVPGLCWLVGQAESDRLLASLYAADTTAGETDADAAAAVFSSKTLNVVTMESLRTLGRTVSLCRHHVARRRLHSAIVRAGTSAVVGSGASHVTPSSVTPSWSLACPQLRMLEVLPSSAPLTFPVIIGIVGQLSPVDGSTLSFRVTVRGKSVDVLCGGTSLKHHTVEGIARFVE
jgi:hypothetical protein